MYLICRNIKANNFPRLLRHSTIEKSAYSVGLESFLLKTNLSSSQQKVSVEMSHYRNLSASGPIYRRDGGYNSREGGYNARDDGHYGQRSYPTHSYVHPGRMPDPHYSMTKDVLSLMNAFVNNTMSLSPPRIFQCGELRAYHKGMVVELTGRLIKKRVSRFVELRDRSNGACQLVINEDNHRVANRLQNMAENTMLTVIGNVMLRPKNSCNFSMPTGEVEVNVNEIINTSFPSNAKRLGQKRNFSTMAEQHNCGITSIEYKMSKSDNILKYFACREMTCNDLRREDIGKTVTLVGWIPYMKNSKFMQLKDGYGHTQIVVEDQVLHDTCVSAPEQTVIQVTGLVLGRPKANINMKYETGEIEVLVSSVKILNPDEPYDGPIRNQDKIQKMSIDDLEASEKDSADNTPTSSATATSAEQNKDEENGPSTSAESSNETSKATIDTKKSDIIKIADTNKFTCRTHNCGELTDRNIGDKVALCGWLHTKRMKRFLILRDGYGQTQILLTSLTEGIREFDKFWPRETILYVEGRVKPRPSAMINKEMKTGYIEVEAEKIEVMNMAKANLPFQVGKCNRVREGLRLTHRYIDLRFADMQQNLRMRSKIIMKMREYLVNYLDFVEVETPTLFRSTPGGAQEFIVPTRKVGHVYSLVQSPQQFKQMLMAGAIDRYFQVARCYRDEATRPDRQPEFTQLDIELSFTTREDVMRLVEEIIRYSWPKDMPKLQTPFRRMTYDEAMDKYGSDKPDTRFSLLLDNVTDICSKNEELVAKYDDLAAYGIVIRGQQVLWSKDDREHYENLRNEFPGNLFIQKFSNFKDSIQHLKSLLGDEAAKEIVKKFVLEEGDLLFLAVGEKRDAQEMMGRIRVEYNNALILNNKATRNVGYKFVWIDDFPLFQYNNECNKLESVHHPFTAPHPEDMEKFNNANESDFKELESIRSQAYDLVLNGQEIGGGSIRIHDRDIQHYVLEQILKIPQEHLVHLLNALESGCPPHGGIALGLDRYIAILRRARSIRDVIAFPKSLNGRDPLSNAPFPISDEEKQLYNIEFVDALEQQQMDPDDDIADRDNFSVSAGTLSSDDDIDEIDFKDSTEQEKSTPIENKNENIEQEERLSEDADLEPPKPKKSKPISAKNEEKETGPIIVNKNVSEPVPVSVPIAVQASVPNAVPTPVKAPVPTPIKAPVPTPVKASVPTPAKASVKAPVPTVVPAPVPTAVPATPPKANVRTPPARTANKRALKKKH